MVRRARENAGVIYRSRLRAIPEGASGVSLSDFRLAEHCKACMELDISQRWRYI